MTEPFADADKLRASWGVYEGAFGKRPLERHAAPVRAEPGARRSCSTAPTTTSSPAASPTRCAVAFTECIGPFWLPGVGHFVQWEAAGVLNRALRCVLLPPTERRAAPVARAHGAAASSAGSDPEHHRLAERGCQHLHADGRSSSPVPNGTLIAGWPARLLGIVQTSERYIASGSAVLAPSWNATVGDVGDEQRVARLVHAREVADDQRAHALRLAVVRVVVARRTARTSRA